MFLVRRGLPGYRKEKSMSNFRTCALQFLKSEDGPTAVEYAVMLALIIAVCIGAITNLGTYTNQTFTSIASAVNVSGS
jgi:pilus assembly protein Flp/PilA